MKEGDIVEYCDTNNANNPWNGMTGRVLHVGTHVVTVTCLSVIGEDAKLKSWIGVEIKLFVSQARVIQPAGEDDDCIVVEEKKGYTPDGFDMEAHRSFMKTLGG